MAIDTPSIGNVGAGATSTPQLNQAQSQELRESFMTLLLTQLENQDPLKPMENAEMTSQLAQINTLSGIEQLNDTLTGITQQMNANKALEASGLIGNAVLVPGDSVKVSANEDGGAYATPFGVELEQPAERLEITVRNQGGVALYTQQVDSVEAGVQSFTWGGLSDAGEPLPPGEYRVTMKAFDADDNEMQPQPLNYAMVQGVTPPQSDEDVRLDLGAVYGQVAMDQIKQIL